MREKIGQGKDVQLRFALVEEYLIGT